MLNSELQGLAVSVSSLERQLEDRESVCDGLRRQLEVKAGGKSSARENELARQVHEISYSFMSVRFLWRFSVVCISVWS